MSDKEGSRKFTGVTLVSIVIAICSLSLNVWQFFTKRKESEIAQRPTQSFHYWHLQGEEWFICDYFDNEMRVNVEAIMSSAAPGLGLQSFPGIKVAHNRRFEVFKEERSRICSVRHSPSRNDIRDWKFLFVVNDAEHTIQIDSIEYRSGGRDVGFDIDLDSGQGLLIPIGFTRIVQSGTIDDYTYPERIFISWTYGDERRSIPCAVPKSSQRASGWFVPSKGTGGRIIIYEPPNDTT